MAAVGRTGLVTFARGSLEDASFVSREFSELSDAVEYVYHVAAQGRDWGPWEEYYSANVVVTSNLVEAVVKNCKKLHRFLHVSTVDVYDPSECTEHCDQDTYVSADRHAFYSKTKVLAERIVSGAFLRFKMPMTIVRPSIVFGPGSWSWGLEEAQLMYQGQGVLIDNGRSTCGAIFIDDIVSGIHMAAESLNSIGKVYNLADNTDLPWRVYFDTMAEGIGVPLVKRSVPHWLAYIVAWVLELVWKLLRKKNRPVLTLFVLALIGRSQKYPINRAYEDFGWRPRVPFKEAMLRTTRWLLETRLHMTDP